MQDRALMLDTMAAGYWQLSINSADIRKVEFLRDYTKLVEENLAACTSGTKPSILLPHESQAFQAEHIDENIHAVFFDMFGTLVGMADGYPVSHWLANELEVPVGRAIEAYKHTASQYLIGSITNDERMIEMARYMGLSLSPAKLRDLIATERVQYISKTWLYADVAKLLAAYRKRNIKTALISNANPLGKLAAKAHGLTGMVDCAVFSCDPHIRVVKPTSTMFEYACQQLGVAPKKVLYVGDGGDFELEMASSLGAKTVLLKHPSAAKLPIRPLSHYHAVWPEDVMP